MTDIKKVKKKRGILDGYKTYDTSNGFGSPDQWKSAFEERMNLVTLTDSDVTKLKSVVDSLYDCKNEEALKKEYRRLMFLYHPDKVGESEDNTKKAQLINDTYFKLKEKVKKH